MVLLAFFYIFASLKFCAAVRRRPFAPEDGAVATSLLDSSSSSASAWAGWRHILFPLAATRPDHPVWTPQPYGWAAKAKDFAKVRREVTRLKAVSSPQQSPSDGSDDTETKAAPGAGVKLIQMVLASKDGTQATLVAPENWLHKFKLDSEFAVFAMGDDYQRFRTRLVCDPTFQVEVIGRAIDDPYMKRELFMNQRVADMQRLPGVGNLHGISLILESVVVNGWTFVMRAVGDGDTEEFFTRNDPLADEPAFNGDYNSGLLALIDVLRGLVMLTDVGMVHSGLTWESIIFRDGRAYITDLSNACLAHDGDRGLGCRSKTGPSPHFYGSAYYLAPEMKNGIPTGPENDVWAAGLFYSELCLGYLPTIPGFEDDFEEEGVDMTAQILNYIRTDFTLEEHEGFSELPKFSRRLLSGMLEKDPEVRWSAQDALEQALLAASEMHLEVPQAQKPLRLPEGWYAFE